MPLASPLHWPSGPLSSFFSFHIKSTCRRGAEKVEITEMGREIWVLIDDFTGQINEVSFRRQLPACGGGILKRERQSEVSPWTRNKGMPPASLNPSKPSRGREGLWLSTAGDGAPTCLHPRVVTIAWSRPTGVKVPSPLLPDCPDTAFSVLSPQSLSGSCKHAHTSQGHTHGSSI